MSSVEPDLFHSMTSPAMNLTLLRAARWSWSRWRRRMRRGAIPLASAEGFIRQVLGWREFMRHVHEATDGYRAADGGAVGRMVARCRVRSMRIASLPSGVLGREERDAVYGYCRRGGRAGWVVAPHHAADGAFEPGDAGGV